MMRTTGEIVKRALRRFGLAKVMTLGELMVLLECSRRTAQRFLKHWGCVISYNCNSSYYALPAVVETSPRQAGGSHVDGQPVPGHATDAIRV